MQLHDSAMGHPGRVHGALKSVEYGVYWGNGTEDGSYCLGPIGFRA